MIVTTHRRPVVVRRAVASALAQSLRDIEVIVVVDGPDDETVSGLERVEDSRLRVHVRASNCGQAAAINTGASLARAPWIALLDDDDEWMPEKLDIQLRTATSSGLERPVVGCYCIVRSDRGDVVWPLRAPRPDEPLSEYLFSRRRRLSFGEGLLQTSAMFAPADVFRGTPWAEQLQNHCDLDWLVRISLFPGVGLVMPRERAPLAVWHLEGLDRMSRRADWRRSFDWIVGRRTSVTRRAYAGFLLTWVGLTARHQGDLAAIPVILAEATRHGRPGARDLAVFASLWCLPLDTRERWSRRLTTPLLAGDPT